MIKYLFPVLIIIEYVISCGVDYIGYGDYKKAIYWLLAAGLNIVVLLMR
jgi:hypothetical protein